MTITWPLALPLAPLVEGFREREKNTTLRTVMDQGPAKTRRLTTAGTGMLTLRYILNKTQLAALVSFYEADTQGGALSFSFSHPRTGAAIQCRFTQPPEFYAISPTAYKANLDIEVLP